jgi:hypothetical protein
VVSLRQVFVGTKTPMFEDGTHDTGPNVTVLMITKGERDRNSTIVRRIIMVLQYNNKCNSNNDNDNSCNSNNYHNNRRKDK